MIELHHDHRDYHATFGSLVHTEKDAFDIVLNASKNNVDGLSDGLYRVFAVLPDGGRRFVRAWSVLGGVVREHNSVTIPAEHW